jgi:hypothetical protein
VKYRPSSTIIPQSKRKDINDKILHLITTGTAEKTGITCEDIFQAYTGFGGLHDLKYDDYANYHEFSEAKKKIEQGQFFTPPSLCEFTVSAIRPSSEDIIADLTCGSGNFINYLPNESNVYGNELDARAYKVVKYLYPNANLTNTDFRYYNPSGITFDLIIGNPPYGLDWGDVTSHASYCIRSAQWLKPGGLLAVIMPSSFMTDEFFDKTMINRMNALYRFVAQKQFDSSLFRQVGVDDYDVKLMVFQRKSEWLPDMPYQVEYSNTQTADEFFEQHVKPVMEEKTKLREKLLLEGFRAKHKDDGFEYEVRKLLYDIKRHPRLAEKHKYAEEYVQQYLTQEKPHDMTYEEWERRRITPNKVLSYLSRIVRRQHDVPHDEVRLVKHNGGLRLKAYSRKSQQWIQGTRELPFVDVIVHDVSYPFEDESYQRLIRQKHRAYEVQNEHMAEREPNKCDVEFCRDFSLYDASLNMEIKLNERQQRDMSRIIGKPYGLLNWQQGSGKTISAIAWFTKWQQVGHIHNTFIVSASLGIHMTWQTKLNDYNLPFVMIERLSDIDRINNGDIVLITWDMLIKFKRHVRAFVRHRAYKIAIVIDESDELTNPYSQRTKAVNMCFIKARYKLLTTGTITRNNINEMYAQIAFLYNHSYNMVCDCPTVYMVNKEGEIEEKDNTYFGEPFPARGGQKLWKACFSPSKTTVFGIKKDNQDVYNADSLRQIIEKTIITRKFEDIVGEKRHEVVTHRIQQNESEKEVYARIIEKFHEMLHYFRRLENPRKDSMLMLIRQIQLLIKATSIPHRFKEYTGDGLPEKMKHIAELVSKFDEKVAIGTTYVDAVNEYVAMLHGEFPNRPIFTIKGEVSFKRRKAIIREFEATNDGILISTQQSLKSSVNIPSCNKVIIESMQWNIPRIEQYYFRFIRYNSLKHTEVHFVTYNYTIEQNLLALLLAKERINEYIKTLEFRDQADVFDEYGIDASIFDAIMEREKDEDGKMKLKWGRQEFSA